MAEWKLVKDDKAHWHYEKVEEEMGITLIGLYGPSRAGKDETARILVEDFGFEQRAQAAAIRKILLGLNPLIQKDDGDILHMKTLFWECDNDWDKVKAVSRDSVDYMIRLGQTCRDEIGVDVWLNTAIPEIGSTKKVVISDVRQPNEYAAIKARGGVIWKLHRPGIEKRGMDGLLDSYEFDATIENRGSLSDLRGAVQATIGSAIHNEGKRGAGYGRCECGDPILGPSRYACGPSGCYNRPA